MNFPWILLRIKVFRMRSSLTFLLTTSNWYICWVIISQFIILYPYIAYTKRINLCLSTVAKLWSGSKTLYSKCIKMAVCFFETGKPRGIRALSSCDRKNMFWLPHKHARSFENFTDELLFSSKQIIYLARLYEDDQVTARNCRSQTCEWVISKLVWYNNG